MKKSVPVTVLALILFAGVAGADDFLGPSGIPFRGAPLSVFAEWEFLNPPADPTFIPPDGMPIPFSAVGGSGNETLYAGFSTHADISGEAWIWDPFDDGALIATGPNGSDIAFNVQNWVEMEPFKAIVIQITYFDPSGQAPPPHVVYVEGQELAGTPGEFTVFGRLSPVPIFNPDENHIAEHWRMEPNPDFEQIVVHVPEGVYLDEVIIDTVSTPEPATLSLLIVGAAVIARYRRRR